MGGGACALLISEWPLGRSVVWGRKCVVVYFLAGGLKLEGYRIRNGERGKRGGGEGGGGLEEKGILFYYNFY